MEVKAYNTVLKGSNKVEQGKSMTYRVTRKRDKVWSIKSVDKRERIRMSQEIDIPALDPDDDVIEIHIKRKLTGEDVSFVCTRGTRIDNYNVYCNGDFKGVKGITELGKKIAQALPAFRRVK